VRRIQETVAAMGGLEVRVGAIHPICVKRKMSEEMRSAVGARTCALRKSVHETARRKGSDFLRLVAAALSRGGAGPFSRGRSTG